jgi:hypothetical protein
MDNIDRFQIIEPKAFPPFILEKTLINMESFDSFSSYIKWVGQVFSCTETIDGVDRRVECIYCVVWPDRNLPLAAGTRVSLSNNAVIYQTLGGSDIQIQNYGGELLFDIPGDYNGEKFYFCLVKRKSIDSLINIPYYDGSGRDVLTATTSGNGNEYNWSPYTV